MKKKDKRQKPKASTKSKHRVQRAKSPSSSDVSITETPKKLVKIPSQETVKTKSDGFFRNLRKCPVCEKLISRPSQHFKVSHSKLAYKDYKEQMVLKKGQGDEIESLEIAESEIDKDLPTKQNLESHGMYNLCTRCPKLEMYKQTLIDVEMKSVKNASNITRHLSYIIEQCCSKTASNLETSNIITGMFIKSLIYK